MCGNKENANDSLVFFLAVLNFFPPSLNYTLAGEAKKKGTRFGKGNRRKRGRGRGGRGGRE